MNKRYYLQVLVFSNSKLHLFCLKKIPLFLAGLGLRCCLGFSLVAAIGGYSSLCRLEASHCITLSCGRAQALGPMS